MYYISEKQQEGISMKFSEMFLKENELKWDDSRFTFENLPENKFNYSMASVQKLNLLLISSELNLPKIYVQSGLNNMFKTIGMILSSNLSCVIDLGVLGIVHGNKKVIHQVPTKQRKESIFNKKASIKSLLLKNYDENLNYNKKNSTKKFNMSGTINNNTNNNYNNTSTNQNKQNNPRESKSLKFSLNAKVFQAIGNTQKEIFNNLNNSNLNSSTSQVDQTAKEIRYGDSVILHKMRSSIKLMNVTNFKFKNFFYEANNKNFFDNGDANYNTNTNFKNMNSTNYNNNKNATGNNFYINANKTCPGQGQKNRPTLGNNFNNTAASNFGGFNTFYNNNNNFNNTKFSQLVNVPFRETDWNFKEMMNCTFRKKDQTKQSSHPVLFNAYSNTKAAPFTSEKTQIPISHRIGSFYSLSLQNFIIDKTTKSIKSLHDEYFLKYKNQLLGLALPATEDEEYLHLLGLYKSEEKVDFRKTIYERYQNYILNMIPDEVLAEIKETWLVNIIKMSMRPYDLNKPDKYNAMLSDSIKEILHIYRISMKQSIMDYILKHPEQREKLGIPVCFRKIKEYAEEKIVRPSDENWEWKKNWNISKIRISNNLMIMSENITKIQKYFVTNLSQSSYLDLPQHYITYSLSSFIDNQKAKIEDQKKIVNEDWKKYIESTLKENKLYKDQMIIYFKSISGVMSSQLRKLILKSIKEFSNFMIEFKKKSYYDPKQIFEEQFNPKFPFQKSFLELYIKAANDKHSFTFSDELSDIHNRLIGIIHELIKCSQDVERPDNMFIKNLEKRNNLWEVPVNDINITEIMTGIDLIIKENLDCVNKVLEIYEPFVFVLREEQELDKFKDSHPKREEIKKRVLFYEEKLKILREKMPNCLYMNLIKIECTEINEFLRNSLVDYIYAILHFIQSKNISGKSKEINDEIEHLIAELKTTPKDEEELYYLENKLEAYKNETVPNIISNYADFIEWVFFYLDYDRYQIFPDNNSKLNDTMGSIETIVRTSHHTIKLISPAMETFESVLKEKRATFEKSLQEYAKEYNNRVEQIKTRVEDKRKRATHYFLDEMTYINLLKEDEKEIQEAFNMLHILVKREELLGAYPTEGEKLENCKKDLDPLINYFGFLVELKEINAFDSCEIKNIDFSRIGRFIEKAVDVMENYAPKVI